MGEVAKSDIYHGLQNVWKGLKDLAPREESCYETGGESGATRSGTRCLESTSTANWDEAQRILRERLAARDNNSLDILRKGKQIVFDEWADHFLEHYSKPPIRTR